VTQVHEVADLARFDSADGLIALEVKVADADVWLTQAQIAALFNTTQQNVALHLRGAVQSGEITGESTHKDPLCINTAARGRTYYATLYNLDAIISVGYRVKSRRGTEFRRWATRVLRERMLGRSAPAVSTDAIERITSLIVDRLSVALIGRLDTLERRMGRVETHSPINGRISLETACDIRALESQIARLEVPHGWPNARAARASIKRDMRDVSGWGSKNQPWNELPAHLAPRVITVLRNRLDAARRMANAGKQGSFGFGDN
jgi:hypothetical protein